MNDKELLNKVEIASLINEVSNDLDHKDLKKVLEKFSGDAHLNLVENGKTVRALAGQEEILETLTTMLEDVSVFFHNNGTMVIDVLSMDQNATASTTAIVKQISEKATTDEDLCYHDKLIKVNGFWYVVERTVEIITKSVH